MNKVNQIVFMKRTPIDTSHQFLDLNHFFLLKCIHLGRRGFNIFTYLTLIICTLFVLSALHLCEIMFTTEIKILIG